MGSFSIWHWLIVLVIVMLIFGTKKLRNIGATLAARYADSRMDARGRREAGRRTAGHGKTVDGEVKGKTEQKA